MEAPGQTPLASPHSAPLTPGRAGSKRLRLACSAATTPCSAVAGESGGGRGGLGCSPPPTGEPADPGSAVVSEPVGGRVVVIDDFSESEDEKDTRLDLEAYEVFNAMSPDSVSHIQRASASLEAARARRAAAKLKRAKEVLMVEKSQVRRF